jgi:hypothetical protein
MNLFFSRPRWGLPGFKKIHVLIDSFYPQKQKNNIHQNIHKPANWMRKRLPFPGSLYMFNNLPSRYQRFGGLPGYVVQAGLVGRR